LDHLKMEEISTVIIVRVIIGFFAVAVYLE
jgi:hypothetical protein